MLSFMGDFLIIACPEVSRSLDYTVYIQAVQVLVAETSTTFNQSTSYRVEIHYFSIKL